MPIESIVAPAVQAATGADVRTAISVLSTVALVLMLVLHEIAVVAGERLQPLARSTAILLAPLIIVFGVIVVTRWPA